ncbi:hypothetical protein GCM10009755_11650 [Brevibacterium samyangense]|uniref:Uncharacterized protein n=1 Tax=Brevibacterium samyangense TaxID=366888 RepID=A0ABN2TBG3_9MICO
MDAAAGVGAFDGFTFDGGTEGTEDTGSCFPARGLFGPAAMAIRWGWSEVIAGSIHATDP